MYYFALTSGFSFSVRNLAMRRKITIAIVRAYAVEDLIVFYQRYITKAFTAL